MHLRIDKKRRKKRYLFMAEPKVSHKHLEEPTPCFEARKQHLVVSVLLTLLFLMASVDEISATSPTVDHRDGLIRIRRDPTMPNDRSMSAADVNDKEDSSRHSSLPLSVDVAGDDNDEIHVGLLSSCSADEYLDTLSNTCQKCVTCGPGTQHKINKECGYGQGENQTCEPCNPGITYQDKTSSVLVRCRKCITCDSLANTTRECSPEHDAECGPCPPGYYYWQENFCVSCKQDRTREECRTTLTTPDPTESIPLQSTVGSDATTAAPVTTSEGTERNTTDPTLQVPCSVPALTSGLVVSGCTAEGVAAEGDNCTYSCTSGSLSGQSKMTCGPHGMFSSAIPTCNGGVDRAVLIGAIGGVLGAFIIAALIFGLVYKILMQKQGTGGETGARVENGTTGGHPGQNCDGVYDIREGEIIPLVAPSQDNSDEQQARQSSLPVGPSPVDPSTVSPPSACNGPPVSGQNAPPASLPREDDAVYQVEWSEDDQPRSLQSTLSVGLNQVSPPSACSGPSVSGQDAPPASLPREDDTVPLSGEMTALPEP